jgi:hypothetical protein
MGGKARALQPGGPAADVDVCPLAGAGRASYKREGLTSPSLSNAFSLNQILAIRQKDL